MIPLNVKLAARIADHYRRIGGTHADTIRLIINEGLAVDAGEADALLYEADEISVINRAALNSNNCIFHNSSLDEFIAKRDAIRKKVL